MRLKKADSRRQSKHSLEIEFGEEALTSHAGLELIRVFLGRMGFFDWLRSIEKRIGFRGDTPFRSLILVILGMLVVGARRLSHLSYLEDDPVFLRFVGLDRVPSRVTVGRFLKQFDCRSWEELDTINTQAVGEGLKQFRTRTLTLDMDGSVLTTGMQVERAFRGFNPHHRKNPSYYPLQVHIAQTTHVLRHRNRSGDVHDSRGAARFVRETTNVLRDEIGHRGPLEWRTDAAFFQRKILEAYDRLGLSYATKVPIVPWLGLKPLIAQQPQRAWRRVDRKAKVQGLFLRLDVPCWQRTEKVAVYRKRVHHCTRKNFQLDLFHPDDGTWEYSAVATNTKRRLLGLYRFMNGRGGQEKTMAELKCNYAFDVIPTLNYGANTAWQKLNVIAHNLMVTFQLRTTAEIKPRSLKRTAAYLLKTVRTMRFEWLNKAGRLVVRSGRRILRLADNPATRAHFETLGNAVARAA